MPVWKCGCARRACARRARARRASARRASARRASARRAWARRVERVRPATHAAKPTAASGWGSRHLYETTKKYQDEVDSK